MVMKAKSLPEGGLDNRTQLADLLTAIKITQRHAAELIARRTHRKCSLRSVQSWLADPALPSARSCPDWALAALRYMVFVTKE